MENLDSSIEKLLNSRPVYSEPLPRTEKQGLIQKMGKKSKLEEEAERNRIISEFGFNQNSLNIDFIRAFLEMKVYCKNLEKRLDETISDFNKAMSAINVLKKELDNVRLRSTLNSNQIEKMDAGLYKYTEKLENYTLSIDPSVRNSDLPKGCVETDISGVIGYYDKIERAQETENTDELERFCTSAAAKSFSAASAFDEVVMDFYGSDKISAIVYTNLNKNSVYKIKFLRDRDVPSGHFSVICSENLFVPRKLMLRSALVIVTGSSPFEELNTEDINNLKFLNDCGLHTYIALDDNALEEMRSRGFRCVSQLSPADLASGKLVKIAEKALESAVPSGAVSLGTLKNMFDNFSDYFLTFPEDISDYATERRKVYPYNCMKAMENAVCTAIKNNYFPTGVVTACTLSKVSDGKYGFVDGTNYVNHLNYEHRVNVYQKAKELLEPGGIFIMNGYDSTVGIKLRSIKGWNYFPNYEALWTREQLIRELSDNGFKIKYLLPTGAGLFDVLPQKYRKSPGEWIVAATVD